MMMLIGSSFYEANMIDGVDDYDIYNMTEYYLNWNDSALDNYKNFTYTNASIDKIKTNRLNRIIVSGINFFGTTAFELSKFFIEFGYENPEYDFDFMLEFVKYVLLVIVILAFAPVILPVLLLLYLLCDAIATTIYKRRKRKRNSKK